jgi:hypothetical protein
MELDFLIKELQLNVVEKVVELFLLELFDFLPDFRDELVLLIGLG